MAHFVETNVGMINLDHVVMIKRAHTRRPLTESDLVIFTDDVRIECHISAAYDLSLEGRGFIVPAAPGTVAIVLGVDESSSHRPDAVWQHSEIIIGWRDQCDHMVPLFRQDIASNTIALLQIGPNQFDVLEFDGDSYDTIDDAKTRFLERRQYAWDLEQKLAKSRASGP